MGPTIGTRVGVEIFLNSREKQKKARSPGQPELNGQAGRVMSVDNDRYVIEMASTSEQVKLKLCNVVALHGHNPWVGEFG